MTHEFWFGTSPAGRHPRCSCGWAGGTTTTLMAGLLRWVSHTGWMKRPLVRLTATTDDRWDAPAKETDHEA